VKKEKNIHYFSFLGSLLVSLLVFSFADAQITFEKWYGGTAYDWGYSVQQTTDGGYIITGWSDSYGAGEVDIYLIKTDASGDTVWTKTYGGTDRDGGNFVQQTSDGGYIITGETWSYGAGYFDVYLIKTDASGNTIWIKTYGGPADDKGNSVQQTTDGGYIITGWSDSYGAEWDDVYLIKTDASGDTVWTKTHGGTEIDLGYSVQQTTDGGYIITGMTLSYGAGLADVYLIKTDSSGDTVWTKTYGGTYWDEGYFVQQTIDGGYIITGGTESYGAGYSDIYLVKTDASGDTLWTKTYGGSDLDVGISVQQTIDGGYIITGDTESYGAGYSDIYLIKTDASGDTLWTKTYGGTEHDGGSSVQQTTDGGYIVTGGTESYGAGEYDVYLIKTDSLGYVGIQEKEDQRKVINDMRFAISPNPFSQATCLQLQSAIKGKASQLDIYNLSGRMVKSIKLITSSYRLGAELSPGIYFLKLNDKPAGKVVKVK
jgi:hypothetical protein